MDAVNLQRHGIACRLQMLDPAGTRDFPPEDYRLKQWLHGEFEAVSRLFGFEQFECPVLESEDLFVRKAGEEITQQLYNFQACTWTCIADTRHKCDESRPFSKR